MHFEFATAGKIVFGCGLVAQLPDLVKSFGSKAMVLTGRESQRHTVILNSLTAAGISVESFPIPGEPTVAIVAEAIDTARESQSQFVIGLGGGSVIDAAKAVAAMLTNPGVIEDYLEVIGASKSISVPAVPCIAIPTTAGTGSEVTRNSVLGVPDRKVKVSMRSPLMLPRIAIVDPQLTLALPPEITASTGLDAITQLLEAFVCTRANPMTDAVCREGLQRSGRSLLRAFRDPKNITAREDMSLAALFSGIALANAGLGAVHGLAGPLGGTIAAPHGAICAKLLPFVIAANVQALRDQPTSSSSLARYDEVAALLTGDPDARCDQLIEWIGDLCEQVKIPGLSRYGLTEKDFPALVESAQRASSMKANPVTLTAETLNAILRKSL
ncbi:MAG: iron-containing alcohol dehydrogenase [Phycisphaerae bacterium]|nr:iron-containing alcohol dehydrogenase [Phycisphaerae bacterium]